MGAAAPHGPVWGRARILLNYTWLLIVPPVLKSETHLSQASVLVIPSISIIKTRLNLPSCLASWTLGMEKIQLS